jgi:hypothetical protein
MPAPLRIILTPEEDRTLTELRLAQGLPNEPVTAHICCA